MAPPDKPWTIGGDGEYTPPSYFYMPTIIGLNYNIKVNPPKGGVITYKWTNSDAIKKLLSELSLGFGVSGIEPSAGVSGVAGF